MFVPDIYFPQTCFLCRERDKRTKYQILMKSLWPLNYQPPKRAVRWDKTKRMCVICHLVPASPEIQLVSILFWGLGKTSQSSSSKPLSNFVSVCLEIWGWFRAVIYFLFQTRPQTHACVDFNFHSLIAVGPRWFWEQLASQKDGSATGRAASDDTKSKCEQGNAEIWSAVYSLPEINEIPVKLRSCCSQYCSLPVPHVRGLLKWTVRVLLDLSFFRFFFVLHSVSVRSVPMCSFCVLYDSGVAVSREFSLKGSKYSS